MTLTKAFAAAAALILIAPVAVAQELPATQLSDHAQVVRHDALTRALLRQKNRRPTSVAEARAICANKDRTAAKLGTRHPNVRRLYALCDRAGY